MSVFTEDIQHAIMMSWRVVDRLVEAGAHCPDGVEAARLFDAANDWAKATAGMEVARRLMDTLPDDDPMVVTTEASFRAQADQMLAEAREALGGAE